MPFIGNTPSQQAFAPAVDYFNGNASTVAFTLSRPVASVAQVQVTIENVPQNPSSSFTVSGSTITFTSAPPSGTSNIYVQYTSPITQVIAPGQGTVTATSMASSTGTGAGVFQTSPTITTPTISSLSSASATALTLQSAGTTAVTVDTSQYVGIGTASPGSKLHVNHSSGGGGGGGQIQMTNAFAGTLTPNKYLRVNDSGYFDIVNSAYSALIMSVTNAGAATQGNNSAAWTVVSDIRLKTNVRQLNSALGKIMELNPCHFEYKNTLGETQTGFIAQEFEKVLPGHVKELPAPIQFTDLIDGDDKTIKSIDANLIPYLVKAIQEQQTLILALTARLETLEAK